MKRFISSLLVSSVVLTCFCAPQSAAASSPKKFNYVSAFSELLPDGNRSVSWFDEDGSEIIIAHNTGTGNSAVGENLPASYDLRSQGRVSAVQNQGTSESCWAFAALGSAESEYITDGLGTASNTNFSEAHMVWFAMRGLTNNTYDKTYGDGYNIASPYTRGGHWGEATSVLARWSGLANESAYPFSAASDFSGMGNYPEAERYVSSAHLENTYVFDANEPMAIKSYIMDEGAVAVGFYYNAKFLNGSAYCYYDVAVAANHDVVIVGWDDNFSKSNFGTYKPAHDGAWLCKNSYGTSWGDGGFFWLSYETGGICDFVGYDIESNFNYDNNYQYDGHNYLNYIYYNNAKQVQFANVFTSVRHEKLEAASFYTIQSGLNYAVQVYTGIPDNATSPTQGALVSEATVNGTFDTYGYHTIKLAEAVELSAGERFAVVVTVSSSSISKIGILVEGPSDAAAGIYFASHAGESFVGTGGNWDDTSVDGFNNVPVKAFTSDADVSQHERISLYANKKSVLVAETAKLSILTAPHGVNLYWTSSNPAVATVNQSGIVRGVGEGTAIITVSTEDELISDSCTVTVVAPNSGAPQVTQPSDNDNSSDSSGTSFMASILAFFAKIKALFASLFGG